MGPLLWAAVDSNGGTTFIWLVHGRHLGQAMGWPEGYLNRDLIFVRNPSYYGGVIPKEDLEPFSGSLILRYPW